MLSGATMVAAAADASKHAPPTEGPEGAAKDTASRLPPTEDKLLLACCRAIKKESGWQERTLRQACDWATGVCKSGIVKGMVGPPRV